MAPPPLVTPFAKLLTYLASSSIISWLIILPRTFSTCHLVIFLLRKPIALFSPLHDQSTSCVHNFFCCWWSSLALFIFLKVILHQASQILKVHLQEALLLPSLWHWCLHEQPWECLIFPWHFSTHVEGTIFFLVQMMRVPSQLEHCYGSFAQLSIIKSLHHSYTTFSCLLQQYSKYLDEVNINVLSCYSSTWNS